MNTITILYNFKLVFYTLIYVAVLICLLRGGETCEQIIF